jgi:hypothetical protein
MVLYRKCASCIVGVIDIPILFYLNSIPIKHDVEKKDPEKTRTATLFKQSQPGKKSALGLSVSTPNGRSSEHGICS